MAEDERNAMRWRRHALILVKKRAQRIDACVLRARRAAFDGTDGLHGVSARKMLDVNRGQKRYLLPAGHDASRSFDAFAIMLTIAHIYSAGRDNIPGPRL